MSTPSSLDATTIFIAREDVVASDMGKDWALLDLETSVYYTLNATGARIWARLQDGGATPEELVEVLISEFEVDDATCQKDVSAVLKQLMDADLVSVRKASEDSP